MRPFSRKAQNIVEYMLLFAAVIAVLLGVAGRNGLLTKGIQESLEGSVDSFEEIAKSVCYDESRVSWEEGGFSPCEGECGETVGEQIQTINCPSQCCDKVVPPTTQECTKPAYLGTWSTPVWGSCANPCIEWTQTRTATCSDPGGCCDPSDQPNETLVCNPGVSYGAWSEGDDWVCNVECGSGTQTQTVTCPSGCCDPADQPLASLSCDNTCQSSLMVCADDQTCCMPQLLCNTGECGQVDNGCGGVAECGACYEGSEIISPQPGTTLTSSTVTFEWTPDPNPDLFVYWLLVWTWQDDGSANILFFTNVDGTSATVTGIPQDGSTVNARLYYFINDPDVGWAWSDYTYSTTSDVCGDGTCSPAEASSGSCPSDCPR